METKDYINYAIMALIIISGVTYTILDTGEELTCRTNAPTGWNILVDHGSYVEAVCPYKTKEPITAYCKPVFRSTASYENYGCSEVILVEQPMEDNPTQPQSSVGSQEKCNFEGCVAI